MSDEIYTKDGVIIEGTYFHDADIIPNLEYQVYGIDKTWFWDNEGLNYVYGEGKSTIKIQVITGTTKTYYKVGSLSLSNDESTSTTEPEGTKVDDYPNDLTDYPDCKVGDIFYKEEVVDENTTYTYKTVEASLTQVEDGESTSGAKGVITDTENAPAGSQTDDIYYTEELALEPSEATESVPYEYNKYGNVKPGELLYVTITPNETLATRFPGAIVVVDGKEHDLRYLNNPITLYMNKDHVISIKWIWGSCVETFRITSNR